MVGRGLTCLGGRVGACGAPLNGCYRSVEMQLTGDLVDHELPVEHFSPWYQPVLAIVVARCQGATCSTAALINEGPPQSTITTTTPPFSCDTTPKRGDIDIWGQGVNQWRAVKPSDWAKPINVEPPCRGRRVDWLAGIFFFLSEGWVGVYLLFLF